MTLVRDTDGSLYGACYVDKYGYTRECNYIARKFNGAEFPPDTYLVDLEVEVVAMSYEQLQANYEVLR